jgi:heme-degrading monooxygenase HmoA
VIARLWHGWTTPANADAYERLLRTEIFARIVDRAIPGFRGIQLLRRGAVAGTAGADGSTEVEFVTLMRFDTLQAVRGFAGEDYEAAVVPPAARALLSRWDARSAHYEVREEQPGTP